MIIAGSYHSLEHPNVIVRHVVAVLSVFGDNLRVARDCVFMRDAKIDFVVLGARQRFVKPVYCQQAIASKEYSGGIPDLTSSQ